MVIARRLHGECDRNKAAAGRLGGGKGRTDGDVREPTEARRAELDDNDGGGAAGRRRRRRRSGGELRGPLRGRLGGGQERITLGRHVIVV